MKTCGAKSYFGGYQETLGEYVDSDKKKIPKEYRESVGMDYKKQEVDQLWIEVQRFIHNINSVMKPILKIFSVD